MHEFNTIGLGKNPQHAQYHAACLSILHVLFHVYPPTISMKYGKLPSLSSLSDVLKGTLDNFDFFFFLFFLGSFRKSCRPLVRILVASGQQESLGG